MFLKLATWNINGIRAILKKGDLISYISQSSPDILCLNEIRIDYKLLEQSDIKKSFSSYQFQQWSCSDKKGVSGVAILSKQKPLNIFNVFTHNTINKTNEFNGRIAIMEFTNNYIISLYSPNAGFALKNLEFRIDIWEKQLLSFIKSLKKPLILCGDLNVAFSEIDLFNPGISHNKPGFTDKERNSFGELLNNGLIDCFRRKYPNEVKYTWWNPRNKLAREQKKGWRLDYFLINTENERIMKDVIIRDDIYGSDHCPVELLINIKDNIL